MFGSFLGTHCCDWKVRINLIYEKIKNKTWKTNIKLSQLKIHSAIYDQNPYCY